MGRYIKNIRVASSQKAGDDDTKPQKTNCSSTSEFQILAISRGIKAKG